ncbi:uncharacterized protein LOC114717701 [Neltuma alba]|uniref:uncharacterized protein LOC114717701 n=1 Tax=Neltuma alba TaxID=207710 RepID=UPI0010A587F2|nr:uncharacterized protein LOC114717701 [Prosopis alba]
MVCDAYNVPSMNDMNNELNENEEPNVHAKRFYDLLKDAETELYPGCEKMSKLSFIVKLLQLKCLNHWSNKSMDALLALLKDVLPEGALVPNSFYEAKKIIRDLGLDYHKIDACGNDCILYWGEHANEESCPKCKMPRWKLNRQKGKKISQKVLRHFSITPRLQRLYMARDTAKEMRWHKEKHTNDGVLRHPADSLVWQHFDQQYPSFSIDPRSVRLGLASDGFQPFGNMSANHSIWPVVLVPYNLPPWLCMKSPYFMMTLLILGPKCPGNEIDVYLQPMIEELKQLWEVGVQTYDAFSESNFIMYAAVLWTINDFHAYGNLSGWSTKGKFTCPCCHKDTHCISLRSKLSYMGHRRFRPQNHPWRKDAKSFDGKEELRAPPIPLTGDEALMQLEQLGNISFGKGQKRKRPTDSKAYNWRKRSIFFQLPYWKNLLIRHNLDVMHIERNVSDNLVSTVMDLLGKTKDTLKSRYDLVDLGIRSNLHPIKNGNDVYKPPAPYTLSSEKKQFLCKFLANLKVPDAFASNISRCVNIHE